MSYIGKIRHTEIISKPMFDLDAYHAPRIRQEFCTTDNDVCVIGRHFDLDIFESADSGRLLVTANTDVNNKPATGTYLFDTTKGSQIICESCGWEKEQFYRGAWLKGGQVLLSPGGEGDAQQGVRFIEISNNNAWQRFLNFESLEGISVGWFVSPSSDAAALVSCNEQGCWLRWLSGRLDELHSRRTSCKNKAELMTVYWENDVPHFAQTAWTRDRTRCKTAAGSPMFPILNRDVYTGGRSATAADIVVGK